MRLGPESIADEVPTDVLRCGGSVCFLALTTPVTGAVYIVDNGITVSSQSVARMHPRVVLA
jgi:hypothetical protein